MFLDVTAGPPLDHIGQSFKHGMDQCFPTQELVARDNVGSKLDAQDLDVWLGMTVWTDVRSLTEGVPKLTGHAF